MGFINLSQSYTSSNLDNASPSVLLNRSIIPFACGLYGLTVWCHIWNCFNNSLTTSFTNSNPLSDWIICGHPYRQIISSYKNHATRLADLSGTGLASAHLVI